MGEDTCIRLIRLLERLSGSLDGFELMYFDGKKLSGHVVGQGVVVSLLLSYSLLQ